MKFAVALLAAAAGVSAYKSGDALSTGSTTSALDDSCEADTSICDDGCETTSAWGASATVSGTGSKVTSWAPHSLTTITVESYTTVCPEPTVFTWKDKTYTGSAGQSWTLSGPATLVVPVSTGSWVSCNSCGSGSGWSNGSWPTTAAGSWPTTLVSTPSVAWSAPSSPTKDSSPVVTGSAVKLVAGGLAGFVAVAAFVL